MLHVIRSIFLLGLVVFTLPAIAATEKRVALVFGNGGYAQTRPLLNPTRDAKAMSEKLKTLGFQVEHHNDRTKTEMERVFRDFVTEATGADIALVFYAGHGIQVNGKNYVIPVDARLRDVSDVSFELIEIDALVSAIEKRAKRTLVFLDACRDNPFIDSMHGYTRSVGSRGLAETEASLGTLVAYAAQPGSVASDGAGHHSPFTAALLKNLGRPGDSISQSLTRVRRAVYDATKGNQIPQDFNSLLDEIYLTPASSESEKEATLRAQIAAAQAKINQLKNNTEKRVVALTPSKTEPVKPKWKAGQRFRDCKGCPEMVVIPPGKFLIGSPDNEDKRLPSEGPQKLIEFTRPFAMGRFEVTVKEFQKYFKDVGLTRKNIPNKYCWEWLDDQQHGRDNKNLDWLKPGYRQKSNYPVTCVSWLEAKSFIGWLSRHTGERYRLPSESEWEYAARAGTKTMFHYGNRISTKLANFSSWHEEPFSGARKESYWLNRPAKVKRFKPNKFGLYQMHGNAWEMVEDCFNFGYRLLPPDGQPYLRDDCPKRIRKGGSWLELPWDLRSARRDPIEDHWREQHVGFRVVRELP